MRTLIAAALVLATATTVGASTTSAQVPTGLEPCTNPGEGVKTFASGPPIKVCDVPAGITHLNIEAWGGQGGDSQHTFSVDRGGPGGYANRLALEATPGLTPVIVVANAGGNSSRADTTGGGGGGSSGVYTSYPAQSLAEVIAIAPGGGGAGCDDGGAGGGIDRITGDGAGQPGFYQNCSKTGDDSAKYNVGRGGANGGGGAGGERTIGGGSGFGGNGGTPAPRGGSGGFGGPELGGTGGPGHLSSFAGGGGGGGGFGGGGGGYGPGGGGGGSRSQQAGPVNWGNGRVALSAPGAETDANGCRVPGTPSGDQLLATPRAERVCGFAGDDRLFGDERRDGMFGHRGDDVVLGGRGNDFLSGGPGFDVCNGNRGKNVADSSCERVINADRKG